MIYLLHFDSAYKHALHYLGFVDGDKSKLDRRLAKHKNGSGARLLQVLKNADIGWVLALCRVEKKIQRAPVVS